MQPLLRKNESKGLSQETIERLTEATAGIEAVTEALRTKGVDLDGLEEPSSILALAVEFLAGVPSMERAERKASGGVIYKRGQRASGRTYAASRKFFGIDDRPRVRTR